jgi:hypothetical protein
LQRAAEGLAVRSLPASAEIARVARAVLRLGAAGATAGEGVGLDQLKGTLIREVCGDKGPVAETLTLDVNGAALPSLSADATDGEE